MSQHKTSGMNTKSVRKMSDKIEKIIGKGDARYWSQEGKLHTDSRSPHFSCKIQVNGRRESFPLRTSNKATAGAKAAKIFNDVVALGWDAALNIHKPVHKKPPAASTVGALIAHVRETAGFRHRTFTTYAGSLRQIAAEIAEIGDQPALDEHGEPRRDRRQRIIYQSRRSLAGQESWVTKVEALPLALFSAEAIHRWRLAYIARAGKAPDARRRAENTATSLIRNARSLFSEKALAHLGETLILPSPLPFAGIKLSKKGNTTYQSKISAVELIGAARTELQGPSFQIFALALLCGLRKREIDLLTWNQVDFRKAVIRIERTAYFEPKSEDSKGEVDIDPELLALLKDWKSQASGPFVIESTLMPRHHTQKPLRETRREAYRCEKHFPTLYTWLRGKGITAQKPLHELRKELGALLASAQGIFAAQSVLRHAQISTTAAYYADKKRTITAGLGAFLSSAT